MKALIYSAQALIIAAFVLLPFILVNAIMELIPPEWYIGIYVGFVVAIVLILVNLFKIDR